MKIAVAFLVLASASALADEAKPAAKEPSAAEKEMMEKYMKAAAPGPEHQQMAKMAGKWKLQVTSWMAPGAPPMKKSAVVSPAPGSPLEGLRGVLYSRTMLVHRPVNSL